MGNARVLTLRELRKLHRRGALRRHLQSTGHESMDAEDLIVRQVELAGRRRRAIDGVKFFVLTGGVLVWGQDQRAQVRRLISETSRDYTLADAVPTYLDFPLDGDLQTAPRFERFFALVLLGPRIEIYKRDKGGRTP